MIMKIQSLLSIAVWVTAVNASLYGESNLNHTCIVRMSDGLHLNDSFV